MMQNLRLYIFIKVVLINNRKASQNAEKEFFTNLDDMRQ